MDYNALLSLVTEIGFRLQQSGAEIYRVEESVQRVLQAYGVTNGEVFAIPNCLIVSVTETDGNAHTRVRRMPEHGTDIFRLEAVNDLCRRLCREVPPLTEASGALEKVCAESVRYPLPYVIAAYVAGSAAFCLFFGGTARDALCSGICGGAMGLCLSAMEKLHTNQFFKTIAGGFLTALVALALCTAGAGESLSLIIIGAIMALTPGVAFTNAMRDMIAGDVVSGITKTVETLLIAMAIAVGTGLALGLAKMLGGG